MTDRFVPDKPGYYWRIQIGADMPTISQIIEDREFYYTAKNQRRSGLSRPSYLFGRDFGYPHLYGIDQADWIAPVAPPDVVDGLVAALEGAEALLRQCEAAAKGEDVNQPHHSGLGKAASIAHAALHRYRGGVRWTGKSSWFCWSFWGCRQFW